jgi:hypothetical protein
MVLVFRSTAVETRTIIQTDGDGRRRVAVATRNSGSAEGWDLCVTNPSGRTWPGTYNGDGLNVIIALTEMLARSENEFKSDKARGDRPAPSQSFDHNRRVVDAVSPIIPVRGR